MAQWPFGCGGLDWKNKISGLLAWLAWLFVHLIFLIGFRNKLAVALAWTYSYLRISAARESLPAFLRKSRIDGVMEVVD